MEENIYKVYIKINANNQIISIQSSAFLSDLTGWTKVDEGIGDKYYHAQSHYLKNKLVDTLGNYNYKYIDNQIISVTELEKTIQMKNVSLQNEIELLKSKLSATDYIAAKLIEGVTTKEEYADELKLRQEWRTRINELEKEVEE